MANAEAQPQKIGTAMPDHIPERQVSSDAGGIAIANALMAAGLVGSTSEGIRMIKQGAVRIDGEKVEDRALRLPAGSAVVCQVGKRRFARIVVQ